MSEKRPRQSRGRAAVRIEEVARIAGVSAITVSRALNLPDKVAEDTRKAVWTAIEKTGYIPNRLARGLASNSSRTVGAIVPTVINSIFADKVQGMMDVLTKAGYDLLLANSGYSLETEAELVSAFLSQQPSGLVVTGNAHSRRTIAQLARSGVALVETWSLSGKPIDMQVGFSNERAAHAMVMHLHAVGYQRIALVCAPTAENDRAAGRLAGYRNATRELGIDDPHLERQAAFSFRNGAEALLDLLSADPRIDAIFFANDILAIGGLFEAQRRGLDVPGRLGIAGFDDVDLAGETNPGLTTVRIPRYEIGARAASMILDRLAGREPAETTVDLGFEIVDRGTTRPISR